MDQLLRGLAKFGRVIMDYKIIDEHGPWCIGIDPNEDLTRAIGAYATVSVYGSTLSDAAGLLYGQILDALSRKQDHIQNVLSDHSSIDYYRQLYLTRSQND